MKRTLRTWAALACLLLPVMPLTGCWDYREVDRLSIVAGVAIDKGETQPYEMTVELIRVESSGMESETISAQGETLFDAARNIIAMSGKRLYWSHNKIIVISEDIASQDIFKVLDWYNRDSETREDIHILVSRGKTAKEIIAVKPTTETVLSFQIDDVLDSEESLGKAPDTDIMDFDIESQAKGQSTLLPAISVIQQEDKAIFQLEGCAIIKDDKLAGFLDGEETKDVLFLRDEISAGLLIEEMKSPGEPTFVTLEVFSNRTKVTPRMENGEIAMDVKLKTSVAIDEVNGPGDYVKEEGMAQLKASAEQTMQHRLQAIVHKMQSQYGADVFGFGSKLYQDSPQLFRAAGDDWDAAYQHLNVHITTELDIKNSATLGEKIRGGD